MPTTSLTRLFDYNEWAWQRVFVRLAEVPGVEYHRERPFFWGSLHGLAAHCYAADYVWWERLHGRMPGGLPGADNFGSFAEIQQAWEPQRAQWRDFVATLAPQDLTQHLRFRDTQGNAYALALEDLLRHLINHATEHRSQMTPTLYQLGYATEPLDYVYFARQRDEPQSE
jgi:uncharacterized damage-inducible protein DinB